MPAGEDGVDRDEREVATQLRCPVERGLAEADDGDLHRGSSLVEARVLEVAHREGVEALLGGLDRAVDGESGAAQLRQAAEVPVGRRQPVHLDLGARVGELPQVLAESLDVRRVLRRVEEALPPDPHRVAGTMAGG